MSEASHPNPADPGKSSAGNELESLTEKFADMLRGVYHCTRVWSAWGWGTMSESDFFASEKTELPQELAEAALAMLAAAPQHAPQERRPLTDEQIIKCLLPNTWKYSDEAVINAVLKDGRLFEQAFAKAWGVKLANATGSGEAA